jgi:uncharacterized protein YcbX
MICRINEDGSMKKVQVNDYPQCSRFSQEIVGDKLHVRYLAPEEPLLPSPPQLPDHLEFPLEPKRSELELCDINLHQSLVKAYRMPNSCDAWFSAYFGFEAALIYIGDGRRPVLGTFAPQTEAPDSAAANGNGGFLSTIGSYLYGSNATNSKPQGPEPYWLTFSDCAPYLITTESSLRNVSKRLATSKADMRKFRPNIVLGCDDQQDASSNQDDRDDAWKEDFWDELAVNGCPSFTMTKMCTRCTSINVDYKTGRMGQGEDGKMLKMLSSDRRVDSGAKYSPVFGRYGFLAPEAVSNITIGDDVTVTKTVEERPVNDWPIRDPTLARYYRSE